MVTSWEDSLLDAGVILKKNINFKQTKNAFCSVLQIIKKSKLVHLKGKKILEEELYKG